MPKKRKLNSKNPKYWSEDQLNKKPIKKKELSHTTKHGCRVYKIWYE